MLRTCTPGGPPHLAAPTPTDGLRRQIINMVKFNDQSNHGHSTTIIYDLRHRQITKDNKSPPIKTPDIRRISMTNKRVEKPQDNHDFSGHLGILPQPCKTSPYTQRREWRRALEVKKETPVRPNPPFRIPSPPRVSNGTPDTSKRPRQCTGRERRILKTKTIRLQNDLSGQHCQISDTSSPSDEKTASKTSGELCEVRGNAINSSPTRSSRAMSPGKRAEVQRRATIFSASLELFRRRLKMNHSKFFGCNKVNPDEYVVRNDEDIRKVPPKGIVMKHIPKPPSPRHVPQTKQDEPEDSVDHRGTTHEDSQVVSGDNRVLPQVQTYVLENSITDQVHHRTFQEPAPLTSHNLSIHNMFMDQQRRRPRVQANGVLYDSRVWRWVEESNANSRLQRVVRFNVSPTTSNELSPADTSRVVSSSDKSRDY